LFVGPVNGTKWQRRKEGVVDGSQERTFIDNALVLEMPMRPRKTQTAAKNSSHLTWSAKSVTLLSILLIRKSETHACKARLLIGHNRYQPDITPVEVAEGETRDGFDGQLGPAAMV
jgi:hypothetical protein